MDLISSTAFDNIALGLEEVAHRIDNNQNINSPEILNIMENIMKSAHFMVRRGQRLPQVLSIFDITAANLNKFAYREMDNINLQKYNRYNLFVNLTKTNVRNMAQPLYQQNIPYYG